LYLCRDWTETIDRRQVVKRLTDAGAMDYTTVVARARRKRHPYVYRPLCRCAWVSTSPDTGRHALVVYAICRSTRSAYRQLSLLLRRPPGREAYPGCVLPHSRLLERAAKMSKEQGGGSLTALPVIETQAVTCRHIPTNVISITTARSFLELTYSMRCPPAVNVGISVSVWGGARRRSKHEAGRRVAPPRPRAIPRDGRFASSARPRCDYAAYAIARARLVEILSKAYQPLPVERQILIIYAGPIVC